jgi:hypothetical protein
MEKERLLETDDGADRLSEAPGAVHFVTFRYPIQVRVRHHMMIKVFVVAAMDKVRPGDDFRQIETPKSHRRRGAKKNVEIDFICPEMAHPFRDLLTSCYRIIRRKRTDVRGHLSGTRPSHLWSQIHARRYQCACFIKRLRPFL